MSASIDTKEVVLKDKVKTLIEAYAEKLNISESSALKLLKENPTLTTLRVNQAVELLLNAYNIINEERKKQLQQNEDIIEELKEKYKDEFKFGTPFLCACEQGRFNDVKLFMTNHDVNGNNNMSLKKMVNKVGGNCQGMYATALEMAVKHNHTDIKEYLVKHGGNLHKVYKKEFPDGTPLVCACEKGRFDDVKLFITYHDEDSSGMTLSEMVNQVGKTSRGYDGIALIRAAKYEHFNVVQYLLQHGEADPSITDKYGLGPLHYAAASNQINIDLIKVLLENMAMAGNYINQKSKKGGGTALDAAYGNASAIKQQIVDLIIKYGGKRGSEL